MTITSDQLVDAGLTNEDTADKIVDALSEACEKFGVDSKLRLAMFLAQASHESMGFRRTEENLNYSAQGLLLTFPTHFNAQSAVSYGHKPMAIANRVYANRMGNSDERSGDGYKYRGRGYIQLTGKAMYEEFSQAMGEDINPDSLATPRLASMSAAWFWNENHLNAYADKGDVAGATRRINGGLNGLAEREALYKKAIEAF